MAILSPAVKQHLLSLGLTTKEIDELSTFHLTDADVAELSRATIGHAELEQLRVLAAASPISVGDILWCELLGRKLLRATNRRN